MDYKYGIIPSYQIHNEKKRLCGAVFKLLPYKQEKYELLDEYFSSILIRINGLNKLLYEPPEVITLLSILESARHETDFHKYRKAILDSCSLINSIKEDD